MIKLTGPNKAIGLLEALHTAFPEYVPAPNGVESTYKETNVAVLGILVRMSVRKAEAAAVRQQVPVIEVARLIATFAETFDIKLSEPTGNRYYRGGNGVLNGSTDGSTWASVGPGVEVDGPSGAISVG